jgi:hypothetical protein
MNVYTAMTLQVAEWWPLSRRIFTLRHPQGGEVDRGRPDKLPSVAEFIADIRLAIGSGVVERHRRLLGIIGP